MWVKGRLLAGFPRVQVGMVLLGDGPRLLAKTGAPVARLLAGTTDSALWSAALTRLPECGDGESASLISEAIAELADGRVLPGAALPPSCPAGTFGLTCLRPGSLPLALLVADDVRSGGDEPPGARSSAAAQAAFHEGLGGRLVPVHVGSDESASDAFRSLAQSYGAIGPGGTPLVVRAGRAGPRARRRWPTRSTWRRGGSVRRRAGGGGSAGRSARPTRRRRSTRRGSSSTSTPIVTRRRRASAASRFPTRAARRSTGRCGGSSSRTASTFATARCGPRQRAGGSGRGWWVGRSTVLRSPRGRSSSWSRRVSATSTTDARGGPACLVAVRPTVCHSFDRSW